MNEGILDVQYLIVHGSGYLEGLSSSLELLNLLGSGLEIGHCGRVFL